MKPKAFADGIPVYCAYDAIVKITDLIENPRNPNRHPQSQITKGAKIIKGNGWRQSIVVSKRSGMITKGHGRRLFAIEGGLSEAPIDYQDYESEAAEWADVLADNELALEAEIELSEVKGILDEVDFSNYDIELTGYNLDELITNIDSPGEPAHPPEDFKEFDENIDTQYCCPKCGYAWSGKPKPNEADV